MYNGTHFYSIQENKHTYTPVNTRLRKYKTGSHKQIEHKKENSQTKISAHETESHLVLPSKAYFSDLNLKLFPRDIATITIST